MGETLTREHMVSWLAAVEASPWRTVGAPQADLRTALEMARASLDLAEQLSTARRELAEALESAGANAEALLLARRELGEVMAVLNYAAEIIGREHSASDNFEARAERFYRDTGNLAPGKDDPYGGTIEERREAWTAWNAGKVEQFRTALAALKGTDHE